MKQNDLAKEYLDKVSGSALYFKDGNFSNMPFFQENDIKAAFNAGRESIVENIPELKWGQVHYLGKETLNAYTLGASFKIEFSGMEFNVYCNYHFVTSALSISFAKQAADNHYRRMVKQALGL